VAWVGSNAPHERLQRERDEVAAQRRLARKKETLRKDSEYLLGLPQFHRFMADFFERGGMMRTVMTGNSQTYYLSGKQDLTREIFAGLAAIDLEKAHELLKPNKFGEVSNG